MKKVIDRMRRTLLTLTDVSVFALIHDRKSKIFCQSYGSSEEPQRKVFHKIISFIEQAPPIHFGSAYRILACKTLTWVYWINSYNFLYFIQIFRNFLFIQYYSYNWSTINGSSINGSTKFDAWPR